MSLHTSGFTFDVENFGGWNNYVSKFHWLRTEGTNNDEHVYQFNYNASSTFVPGSASNPIYETIVYKNGAWYDYHTGSNPWTLSTTNGITQGTDQTGTVMMKWGHTTAAQSFPDPTISSGSGGGTSTESLNTGSVTQNMDGSLSFQVHASSDSSETYSISLNNVNKASIVPSGVGPWYKNYTNSEHTAIGYGTWRLYDQNSILADITTTAPATPPAQSTDSSTSTIKKVFCNFW